MAARVQLDLAALDRLLRTSPQLRAYLTRRVAAGVRFAQGIAPDAPVLRKGYVEGLRGEVGVGPTGVLTGRIRGEDYKTLWIEKGTAPHSTSSGARRARGRAGATPGRVVSTPAHHVLSRTLDHLAGG